MMQKIIKFMGIEKSRKWLLKFGLSWLLPLIAVISRPMGLDLRQSVLVGILILTVIWWSASVIAKIPASLFLLAGFALLQAAPLTVIFSFPLSESFFLIVLTYVFSKGIVNSGLIEKLIEPRLLRWCTSPVKILLVILLLYVATIYIIPQPLARLIIISNIMDAFLKETDLPDETRSILMYAVFAFYTLVNIGFLDADLIMNRAAVGFGGQTITNFQWMKYMLVPTILYISLVLGVFVLLFQKELVGIRVQARKEEKLNRQHQLEGKDWRIIAALAVVVLLWMTSQWHGISPLLVTVVGIGIMYFYRILQPKDFLAIDGATLIFLTAAFSIGGAMKGSGVADKVFGLIRFVFPTQFGLPYLLVIVLVGMIMHMILGSNVTTLSVVTPGLLVLGNGLFSGELLVYILIVTVSFHAILPFHNVAIMIGSSKGYYPVKYVSKVGLAVTPLVFLAAVLFYYPWWLWLGLK